MKKINLNELFYYLRNQHYVIVKFDKKFPKYQSGQDIDIFCLSREDFLKKLFNSSKKYIKFGYSIKVTHVNRSHTHFDLFYDENLELRLDIYESLPNYTQTNIKECLFYSIIENSRPISKTYAQKKYSLNIPSEVDELLVRYFEYREWYKKRPGKIKHLKYLKEKIKKTNSRINFFDKLHYYTSFPTEKIKKKTKRSPKEFLNKKKQEVIFILGKYKKQAIRYINYFLK